MIKIIKKCHKEIKSLEKNRKGIRKVIKTKLEEEEFKKLKLTNPSILSYKQWQVYKIYCTSSYGDYRIIVAENKLENKLVCDFYFKSEKYDLSSEEYKEIKTFLENCCDNSFFANLDDF